MIKQLKFVSICVRDQDRALAFWTEKMGFQVVTDQPMGEGMRWIELKIPGAQSGVVLFTPPGADDRIGSFSGISFMSENVERTHKELSAKGVEFVRPPKQEPYGMVAVFRDLYGNLWDLVEPRAR